MAKNNSAPPGKDLHQNIDRAQHVSEMLKALAHPIRLRIIALLCQGREHVTGLSEQLEVPQAIISQQLRILRMKGLVLVERSGGFAYYQLGEPELENLVHCMEGCRIK
jgi:DNA-binding transcriptional ArsR family regulator